MTRMEADECMYPQFSTCHTVRVGLYNDVLLANLEPWSCLSQVLVLGNSFHKYQERWSVFPQPMSPRPDCLLELQKKHVKEYIVDPVNFPLASAFNDMSWHFFPTTDGIPKP
jgi:hypothetical protein